MFSFVENVPKVRYRKIKFMTKKNERKKFRGKIKESELLAVRRLQGNE